MQCIGDPDAGSSIATVDEYGPPLGHQHQRSAQQSAEAQARLADHPEPLQHGCVDVWNWSKKHRSQEVVLSGVAMRTALFHPNWSKGSAGVRGTKVMNNGRYYWEIQVTKRIFGTR